MPYVLDVEQTVVLFIMDSAFTDEPWNELISIGYLFNTTDDILEYQETTQ